jgi:raffinose/stachyose/melibiose transport system permease protein
MGLYLALGIMIPIRIGTVAILEMMVATGLVNTLWALILVYTAQGLPLASSSCRSSCDRSRT